MPTTNDSDHRLFIIPSIPTSTKTRSLPSVHKATDVRLGRIVRLLMSNATVVVSGTKIAEEIGTSRSEVWRLIQQLRGLGVDVAGHPATGYQLRAVPDLLLPEMLTPSLKGTIFGRMREADPSLLQNRLDQFGGDAVRGGGRAGRQRISCGRTTGGARTGRAFMAFGAVCRVFTAR